MENNILHLFKRNSEIGDDGRKPGLKIGVPQKIHLYSVFIPVKRVLH